MAESKEPLTREGSHVATRRGYAAGRIVEEGDPVPAGIAVSSEWMAPSPAAASLRRTTHG